MRTDETICLNAGRRDLDRATGVVVAGPRGGEGRGGGGGGGGYFYCYNSSVASLGTL